MFIAAVGFLEFWALARFFEYLNLTDGEFDQRLQGADLRVSEPVPMGVPNSHPNPCNPRKQAQFDGVVAKIRKGQTELSLALSAVLG